MSFPFDAWSTRKGNAITFLQLDVVRATLNLAYTVLAGIIGSAMC